ncbi:hypothetical protein YC2023_075529 [Brassica napus]
MQQLFFFFWKSFNYINQLKGTTEWNEEVLQLIFPFEAESILTIKPSSLGAPDKLFWVHMRDGEYTTKSGYVAAVAFKK